MQFVEFNAVVKRHSRVAHAGDRQPAVCHRRARGAACTEDDHVDESRAIGARIEARNHAARGWQAAPRCVGHTDSRAKRPGRACSRPRRFLQAACGSPRSSALRYSRTKPVLGRETGPSVFHPELKNFAFGDPGGAERRQIVAPPLLGHPYTHLAKPHDVHNMPIVLLDFRRGKIGAPSA